MKATVKILKSFDVYKQFSKVWEDGDFKEFFTDEGEYLDSLSRVIDKDGIEGNGFEVIFMVTVEK